MIEVKYREQAAIGEKDAIYELADQSTCAIVVTKREDDYGIQPSAGEKKLLRLPTFAFLYMLGNAEKNGYKGAR